MTVENSFLSIREFSKLVRVHPNTIRRAIKSGRINAIRIGSGKKGVYRIPASEINRIALIDLEELIKKIIEEREKTKDQNDK